MVFSEGGSAVGVTVSTVLVLYCTALNCKYYWYCTPTVYCSVSGGWIESTTAAPYTDVQQVVLSSAGCGA